MGSSSVGEHLQRDGVQVSSTPRVHRYRGNRGSWKYLRRSVEENPSLEGLDEPPRRIVHRLAIRRSGVELPLQVR